MPEREREFRRFSESLREAFRRLSNVSASDEETARLTRRLLAVTRAAKHDVRVAARKLEVLIGEAPRLAESRRRGRAGGAPKGPGTGPGTGPDGGE
jgi:hypothetical protein